MDKNQSPPNKTPVPENSTLSQNPPKKPFPKWIIAIGGIMFVALVAVGASIAFTSSKPTPPTLNQTENDSEISWQEATSLIHNCEVDMVFQTHNLDVTLTLKDGTQATTKEPAIDDVFEVVENAQEACGTIPLATE